MRNTKNKGFTLIELMIVVAIIGIISAIALPSYSEYIKKGKRTDAKVELLRIAQMQESYFVQNLSYAKSLNSVAGGLGLGTDVKSEQEVYSMSIVATPSGCTGLAGANACTGYTLKAVGTGAQDDDGCGDFTLAHTGAKDITDNDSAFTVDTCW